MNVLCTYERNEGLIGNQRNFLLHLHRHTLGGGRGPRVVSLPTCPPGVICCRPSSPRDDGPPTSVFRSNWWKTGGGCLRGRPLLRVIELTVVVPRQVSPRTLTPGIRPLLQPPDGRDAATPVEPVGLPQKNTRTLSVSAETGVHSRSGRGFGWHDVGPRGTSTSFVEPSPSPSVPSQDPDLNGSLGSEV